MCYLTLLTYSARIYRVTPGSFYKAVIVKNEIGKSEFIVSECGTYVTIIFEDGTHSKNLHNLVEVEDVLDSGVREKKLSQVESTYIWLQLGRILPGQKDGAASFADLLDEELRKPDVTLQLPPKKPFLQ